MIEGPVCLIVNPHAGGGRAAAAAARRRGGAARARAGRSAWPRRCRCSTRASWPRGARRGRDRRRDGRRRASPARSRASCARLRACSPCCPAGAATTSRASWGSRRTPSRRRSCWSTARSGGSTWPMPTDLVYLGILSAGFDSDVSRIALETRLKLGTFVYTYGVLRAIAALAPGELGVTVDGERREFSGYSVAVANRGVFGGGMCLAPDASLEDGMLDVVHDRQPVQAALPARAAAGVQRHAPAGPGGQHRAGPRDHLRGRPAVHRLRRRRPDRRPTR